MTILPSGSSATQVLDAAGDPGDLGDEGLQGAHQRAYDVSLGIALGLAGAACGGGVQAGQQHLGRAATAIALLGEKPGQALGAERAAASGAG